MPIANSFNDGQISFTTAKFGSNLRNTLAFQALPRVLATFRYSGIGNRDMLFYKNTGYSTWDRSFDLKFQFLKENDKLFLPSISTGFQDIVGTGVYSAEYLVASKTIFKNFRASGGLGWGRLGSRNLVSKNSIRPQSTNYRGGTLRYKQLFKGNIGAFGGLEYSPSNKYKLKMELSSDSYENDVQFSKSVPTSRINYGLDYFLSQNSSLSAFYVNGNHAGIQINVSLNPISDSIGDFLEGNPEPFYSEPFPINKQNPVYWDKANKNFSDQYLTLLSYKEVKNEVQIVITNNHYSSNTQAIGRALRVLSKYIPLNFSVLTVILSENGMPISKISIDRYKLSEIIDAPNAELLSKEIITIENAPNQIFDMTQTKNEKKNKWKITPYAKVHLFDPSKPVYYDTGIRMRNIYQIKHGLFIEGQIEKSILTEFDDIWRGKKGRLPFVRTDQRMYLNSVDDPRLSYLILSSFYKLPNEIYGKFSLGYLEKMFAGASSEVLYFPHKSNFALGGELNYVRPREYNQQFGLRSIDGMANINGHISGYWDTNFYDYTAQLDYGKYLAGDIGNTLTLTRNFRNGWKVGGFFSITDATFDSFGEGSFDKGFFFRIPFNPFNPYETRSGFAHVVRPLSGDGGQRIRIERLYETLSKYSRNNLNQTWSRIWR